MRINTIVVLIGFLIGTASAHSAGALPTQKEAAAIISTHEDIKASFYKVIRITLGKQMVKEGFIHENVLRVTAFAPASAGRPMRGIKHYLMHYTEEYGWFLEAQKSDSRGVYLEISSQKKGRVFVR